MDELEESTEIVELLIPDSDTKNPEFSIVVPSLNEEITISEFIRWCKQGLESAGVLGEILIVDSSSDRTAEIALSMGARVLKTPRGGLGRAYIDAVPYIRGRYVLMGDADCTYDFRRLGPFIEEFRQGSEFIMGSRFKGYIEPGSMPALHRYLGTPVTTWILNRLYSSSFSDIHCGMRGMTVDALVRMNLQSQSWEYASEMVLKAVHMGLRTCEVPVRFLKDKEGRLSHHKRAGWFSPWQAGWINLRAMFIYGADFFVLKPGIGLFILGLLITGALALGPVSVGAVEFSLNSMLIGVTLTVLGLQSFFLGCLAQILYDYTGRARSRWLRIFKYTRTVLASAGIFATGIVLTSFLAVEFFRRGFSLPDKVGRINHLAVAGALLMICGFTLFMHTLLIHAASQRESWKREGRA